MAFLVIFLVWWLITFIPTIYINGSKIMKNYAGITLAPFVIYKDKRYLRFESFIKHEREHVKQQRIYSPLVFYLLYVGNYLINRLQGMDHYKAYYEIYFEKLARRAERK